MSPQVPGVPDHAAPEPYEPWPVYPPPAPPRAPIETKVKYASLLTAITTLLLVALNYVASNGQFLASLGPFWQGLILVLVPTLSALIGGYFAPHSPRPGEGEGGK